MKITVFGSGYVGLVAGACFAESGNDVICVDVDERKINMLNRGEIPIYEPGLEEMVKRNMQHNRLRFTTDAKLGVEESLFQFIAVGTPPDEDGSADLQYVLSVAKTIGQYMNDTKVIVDKSTVPVGTGDKVRAQVDAALKERGVEVPFDVVSNPEFLREGVALHDFMEPDRVVVGAKEEHAIAAMKELYAPFMPEKDKILVMDLRSAEMTKYAANSMLATKISFMNEVSRLCDLADADIDMVRLGIGADHRIGPSFLFPGVGYGGSCFPKDVQALIRTGAQFGLKMDLLESVEGVNERQKGVLLEQSDQLLGKDLQGKTIAIWGLSFKPQTDDMREAPSRVIVRGLLDRGAKIQVHDPEAMEEAKRIFKEVEKGLDTSKIEFFDEMYSAVEGAEALVILTEWNEFRRPDFEKIKSLLHRPLVLDGRNIYEPKSMKSRGFEYFSIGRP